MSKIPSAGVQLPRASQTISDRQISYKKLGLDARPGWDGPRRLFPVAYEGSSSSQQMLHEV